MTGILQNSYKRSSHACLAGYNDRQAGGAKRHERQGPAIGLSFLPFWLFLDLLSFPQVEAAEGRKNDKKPIVGVLST